MYPNPSLASYSAPPINRDVTHSLKINHKPQTRLLLFTPKKKNSHRPRQLVHTYMETYIHGDGKYTLYLSLPHLITQN